MALRLDARFSETRDRTCHSNQCSASIACSALLAAVGVSLTGSLGRAIEIENLPRPVTPADRLKAGGRQVSLYDMLRVGLKAKTEADFEYIAEVVKLVDEGKLPRDMVDSSFLYARYRYRTHPGSFKLRPMVYFQPSLTARAKKIGVCAVSALSGKRARVGSHPRLASLAREHPSRNDSPHPGRVPRCQQCG